MAIRAPAGCEYFPAGATPAGMEDLVREFAFKHGETYSTYLVTEDGWETFWCEGRRGLVRFVRWCGCYAMSVGGLMAPPEDQELLLQQFQEFATLNRLVILFVNLGSTQLDPFRKQGWQVTKCGEEPLVRLDSANWKGKEFEWLRRQENFCKRQGLELIEVLPDERCPIYVDEIVPELTKISEEHINSTLHGRELRFMVGRFQPLKMGHRRLFVVRKEQRLEAFLVCDPSMEGSMWAIEMYRRRADATRGAIPFAILQTMRILQEEGVPYCSLSGIPMFRCDLRRKNDSWAVQGASYLWWRLGNWLFDVRGIYHFKSRFRPEYRELFVVAWPRAGLLAVIGIGRVWGVLSVSPTRLLHHVFRWLTKRDERNTLASPDPASTRRVRRLPRSKTADSAAATEPLVAPTVAPPAALASLSQEACAGERDQAP